MKYFAHLPMYLPTYLISTISIFYPISCNSQRRSIDSRLSNPNNTSNPAIQQSPAAPLLLFLVILSAFYGFYGVKCAALLAYLVHFPVCSQIRLATPHILVRIDKLYISWGTICTCLFKPSSLDFLWAILNYKDDLCFCFSCFRYDICLWALDLLGSLYYMLPSLFPPACSRSVSDFFS